jgi:hypothetical protein
MYVEAKPHGSEVQPHFETDYDHEKASHHEHSTEPMLEEEKKTNSSTQYTPIVTPRYHSFPSVKTVPAASKHQIVEPHSPVVLPQHVL